MKTKYFFLSVLLVTQVGAASLCRGEYADNNFLNSQFEKLEDCKAVILDTLFSKYKKGDFCIIEKEVKIQWAYGPANAALQEKKLECKVFHDAIEAEGSVVAVTMLNDLNKINEKKDDCPEPAKLVSTKASVVAKYENKKDFEAAMKRMNIDVSDIFDRLKNGSFTARLVNDNNPLKLGTKGSGSDRGLTHGMSLRFDHNIKDGTYQFGVQYDSLLFTSYKDPANPNYTHVGGVTHVDQSFLEENVLKLELSKTKTDNNIYWTTGGGFQELNKDDSTRPFLISAARQQLAFHDFFIALQQKGDANKRVTTKVYNDIAQQDSQRSLFYEGAVGARVVPLKLINDNVKIFVDGEINGRLTGITNASYIGAKASLNMDLRLINNLGARATIGKTARYYSSGEVVGEKTMDVTVGTRAFQVGVKIVNQDNGRLLKYQNPLPKDFPNRTYYAPGAPKTFQVLTKIYW
jgi:hypothetical protein